MFPVNIADAEKALVSSLCANPALFGLLPHKFSGLSIGCAQARLLFEEAQKLWLKNSPVTFDVLRLLLAKELDVISLEEIWSFVPSGANFEYYLKIVLTHARTVFCIGAANRFLHNLNTNPGPFDSEYLEEIVAKHTEELALKALGPDKLESIQEQVIQFNDWILGASESARAGVKFGLERLDDILGSVQPGDMVVIGGPTGQGKSALALQAADCSIGPECAVVYFSLEMPARQLIGRLVSRSSGVPFNRILKGKVTAAEVQRIGDASEAVARLPLWIVDSERSSPQLVTSTLRRLKTLGTAPGLVIVDYVQLLKDSGTAPNRDTSRENVVAEFARSLKETAVTENVVVLALSQLNDDGRLRESRAIGQHADIVVMLKATGADTVLSVEKHRNGPRGALVCEFEGERFLFRPKQTPPRSEQKKNEILF